MTEQKISTLLNGAVMVSFVGRVGYDALSGQLVVVVLDAVIAALFSILLYQDLSGRLRRPVVQAIRYLAAIACVLSCIVGAAIYL